MSIDCYLLSSFTVNFYIFRYHNHSRREVVDPGFTGYGISWYTIRRICKALKKRPINPGFDVPQKTSDVNICIHIKIRCQSDATYLLQTGMPSITSILILKPFQRRAPSHPSKTIRSIVYFKIFTALLSSIVLCVILSLTYLTPYKTRAVFIIEYCILAIVWFAYSLVWINSIQNNL